MKFQIKSRFDASVLFEAEVGLRACVELAISEKIDLGGADLRNADLGGAYLRGADLRNADLGGACLRGADLRNADLGGTKIDDLMCINDLQDAIDLAPMIFDYWEKNDLESTQKKFDMYEISGENRALVLMCPLLIGGYCFVLERREIWWWQWSCPNPETVPVLWRES